jgi:transglutaminase-like putative cysteine protease
MSEAPSSDSRLARGLEMLPVLAALALLAVAHGGWLLCAPAAVLLGVAVLSRLRFPHEPRWLLLAAGAGALLGGLLLLVLDSGSAPGPIPPLVMGPLCGAMVGLSTFCAISGRQDYALTYALLLSALSAAVPESRGTYLALAGVAASLLLKAFLHGRLGRAGLAGGLGFGVFALVTLGATAGTFRFVRWNEGLLTEAIYRFAQNAPRPNASSLQSEISLARRGRMPETERLLFEVRGERPKLLRTSVFDAFDGTRWTTSAALEAARLTLVPPRPGEALQVTELALLEPLGTALPAPAGTRAVEGATPRVHGGWMLRADRLEGASILLRREQQEQLPPEARPGGALTALPEELLAELRPLALELTRGATTSRERAKALEAWFRDNYEYSLSVDLEGQGSPLAILIRERRPAWCVYFASAMAALLRSLEVPARVAGGFVPEETNPFSGATLVRERDAHAWVEVYLEDEGRFVPFDPTPWRSREALLGARAPGTVDAVLQAVSSSVRRWTSRVLGSPGEALRAVVMSPLVWLVVGALVGWRWLKRSRRERAAGPRAAMRGADPRLTAAYTRFLRALKRGAGLVPSPAETDDELLSRLRAARAGRAVGLAEEFITRYRRARYGGGEVDVASLGALAAEFDRTLRQERAPR